MIIGADRLGCRNSAGVSVDVTEADIATIAGASGGAGSGITSATTDGITAHAGGTQALAVALVAKYNRVSVCATAGDSVSLVPALANEIQTVKNDGAASLAVFPAGTDTINSLAASLAVDIPAGGLRTFYCSTSGAWRTERTISLPSPSTQKGALAIKCSDNAAEYEVVITNASFGQAATVTLPDPGAVAGKFVLDRGAANVVTGLTALAGGGQAGATALLPNFNNVTVCATIKDSLLLPPTQVGINVTVRNLGATACEVFPPVSSSINALAVNLGVMLGVGAVLSFEAISATVWVCPTAVSLPAPTTEKGSVLYKAADSAGNTTTTIVNASQAAARTYTYPDAGADAGFLMTTGATPTATTATTTEITNAATDAIASFTTTATPASGSCGVQFVFKNAAGVAVSSVRVLEAWISDINGLPVTAITSFAALTNGSVDLKIVGKIYNLITTAAGLMGVTFTGSAATRYMSVRLNNGTVLTSTAIIIN